MKKCKVCGRRLRLLKENKYEIVQKPVGMNALTQGTKIYEAFDCIKCGCQNIVNIREESNQ